MNMPGLFSFLESPSTSSRYCDVYRQVSPKMAIQSVAVDEYGELIGFGLGRWLPDQLCRRMRASPEIYGVLRCSRKNATTPQIIDLLRFTTSYLILSRQVASGNSSAVFPLPGNDLLQGNPSNPQLVTDSREFTAASPRWPFYRRGTLSVSVGVGKVGHAARAQQ